MKKVSDSEWKQKANNLTKWRENRTSPPNLDLYNKIVSMVHVGQSVLDCGCGQRHLANCLPSGTLYTGVDPFPIKGLINEGEWGAEDGLTWRGNKWKTVFMLAALDNVQNVYLALKGLKNLASENIVILTGIGIKVDMFHTHQIDRKDLTDVLGEPTLEVELSPRLFLFEWKL